MDGVCFGGFFVCFFTLNGASVMPGIFRTASPVTNTSATEGMP